MKLSEKQMKSFHETSHRIKSDFFFFKMPNHELVIASNLQKDFNCFEPSLLHLIRTTRSPQRYL